MSSPLAFRGRGTSENPPNRFDRLHAEIEPEALDDDEHRQAPTTFLRDATRSALSRNGSPDIPFDYSLNPYRGCEHGCSYCLHGDTRILMGDGTTRRLADVRKGDEIYGTIRRRHYRHLVRTSVLDHWRTTKPAYRVRLADGTVLVASGDHRLLTERGWKHVRRPGHPSLAPKETLVGMESRSSSCTPPAPPPARALIPRTASTRASCPPQLRGTASGPLSQAMGPEAGGAERTADYAPLPGPIAGQALIAQAALRVVEVVPLPGERELFDITTGTGDFIANGVVSHNCYARPTHEYLGFSPGLDFETKIVVKHDAPRLLSAAFQKPSWAPAVVSVSGATDPYQPVERRLRLTRACLAVFLRHRNPVSIITKNVLVVRDLDLLAELAALGLVHVRLSVTSLRDDVIGAMEPRTSRPAARLRAVEKLAEAGVPVAVHAAPLIPGLTDEELPAIYAAAAEAGAQAAGFMVLRLPGAVGELFPAWLARHFPERYAKVMGRLTEVRGGRLDEGRFHERFRLHGPWADTLRQVARGAARRHGLDRPLPPLATHHFRRLAKGQMDLF